MKRLEELRARRARLLARAQSEREQLALGLQPVTGALKVLDTAWAAVLWLRERPLLAVAAAALALAAGPRRGLRWIRLALGAWQAWRWMSERGAR